jgi:hypothetical protein
VTYLREQDPADLLRSPSLAPLASLGRTRGGPTARSRLLRRALGVIASVSDAPRRDDLAATAAVLAAVHLDLTTIVRAGREAGMPISLEGTEVARAIAEAAEARGMARGKAEGMAEGAARERSAVVAELLEDRYGPDPRISGLAERLVDRPTATVLAALRSAPDLRSFTEAVGLGP